MKHPNQKQLKETAVKEFNGYTDKKYWKLVSTKEVPRGTRIIDTIWSTKQNTDILSGIVIKWKSSLIVYREQKLHVVSYTETYAPVSSW